MFVQLWYSPWQRTIVLRKRVRASERKRRRCPTRTPIRTTMTKKKKKWEKLEISGNRAILSQGFYLTIVYINELQNRIGLGQLGEVALLLQEHPRQRNPLVGVAKGFAKSHAKDGKYRRRRGARRETRHFDRTRQENPSDVTSRTF